MNHGRPGERRRVRAGPATANQVPASWREWEKIAVAARQCAGAAGRGVPTGRLDHRAEGAANPVSHPYLELKRRESGAHRLAGTTPSRYLGRSVSVGPPRPIGAAGAHIQPVSIAPTKGSPGGKLPMGNSTFRTPARRRSAARQNAAAKAR